MLYFNTNVGATLDTLGKENAGGAPSRRRPAEHQGPAWSTRPGFLGVGGL